MNTFDRVGEVLRAVLELPATVTVESSQRLQDDLAMNSLRLVTVLTELCDVCGIDVGSFSVADIRALKHVSDLVALVEREIHA